MKFLLGNKDKVNTKKINNKIGLAIGNTINHIVQKKKISLEMLLGNQEYCEQIINTEIQDALDREGIFVSNIKLKAVDFNKRSKGKVNDYLSSRPNVVKPFDVNATFNSGASMGVRVPVKHNVIQPTSSNTMQNAQNMPNVLTGIECKICHKKNAVGTKICINCGNKLI